MKPGVSSKIAFVFLVDLLASNTTRAFPTKPSRSYDGYYQRVYDIWRDHRLQGSISSATHLFMEGKIRGGSTDGATNRSILVTGVGRSVGIGNAIAAALALDGWTVVTSGYVDYDAKMMWGADVDGPPQPGSAHFEADLADPDAAKKLVDQATQAVGPLSGLVMCHCESTDSSILTTTVESFDLHFAVNARAPWLLIKAFAEQFPAKQNSGPSGRIVAITSDHTEFNLPYGSSKAALDRIVIAAATELAPLGITANVVNPGATDTGWASPDLVELLLDRNLQPRVGLPQDCANLIRFLCSPEGQWINAQVLYSDGGIKRI